MTTTTGAAAAAVPAQRTASSALAAALRGVSGIGGANHAAGTVSSADKGENTPRGTRERAGGGKEIEIKFFFDVERRIPHSLDAAASNSSLLERKLLALTLARLPHSV